MDLSAYPAQTTPLGFCIGATGEVVAYQEIEARIDAIANSEDQDQLLRELIPKANNQLNPSSPTQKFKVAAHALSAISYMTRLSQLPEIAKLIGRAINELEKSDTEGVKALKFIKKVFRKDMKAFNRRHTIADIKKKIKLYAPHLKKHLGLTVEITRDSGVEKLVVSIPSPSPTDPTLFIPLVEIPLNPSETKGQCAISRKNSMGNAKGHPDFVDKFGRIASGFDSTLTPHFLPNVMRNMAHLNILRELDLSAEEENKENVSPNPSKGKVLQTQFTQARLLLLKMMNTKPNLTIDSNAFGAFVTLLKAVQDSDLNLPTIGDILNCLLETTISIHSSESPRLSGRLEAPSMPEIDHPPFLQRFYDKHLELDRFTGDNNVRLVRNDQVVPLAYEAAYNLLKSPGGNGWTFSNPEERKTYNAYCALKHFRVDLSKAFSSAEISAIQGALNERNGLCSDGTKKSSQPCSDDNQLGSIDGNTLTLDITHNNFDWFFKDHIKKVYVNNYASEAYRGQLDAAKEANEIREFNQKVEDYNNKVQDMLCEPLNQLRVLKSDLKGAGKMQPSLQFQTAALSFMKVVLGDLDTTSFESLKIGDQSRAISAQTLYRFTNIAMASSKIFTGSSMLLEKPTQALQQISLSMKALLSDYINSVESFESGSISFDGLTDVASLIMIKPGDGVLDSIRTKLEIAGVSVTTKVMPPITKKTQDTGTQTCDVHELTLTKGSQSKTIVLYSYSPDLTDGIPADDRDETGISYKVKKAANSVAVAATQDKSQKILVRLPDDSFVTVDYLTRFKKLNTKKRPVACEALQLSMKQLLAFVTSLTTV